MVNMKEVNSLLEFFATHNYTDEDLNSLMKFNSTLEWKFAVSCWLMAGCC